MQERGRKRLGTDPEVGENLRDRHRMRDVGLSASALLPGVGALCGGVGALDERKVGLRMVDANRLHEPVDGAGRLGARKDSRQQRSS